jgi:carbonic anhydrase
MINAEEALSRLLEGNQRFVMDVQDKSALPTQSRRHELLAGQKPFAVVLGCSDSRVPLELIFDQGLGDLFVIRVAGNIVAPSQIGSVEFAVEQFGTPLVVVLGHSNCGAIKATLDQLERPAQNGSPNLKSIVDRISPALATLVETNPELSSDELMSHAIRANIRASVNQLRHGSAILERLVGQGKLLIVGGEYCLKRGLVEILDQEQDQYEA